MVSSLVIIIICVLTALVVVLPFATMATIYLYRKWTTGICKSSKRMDSKVVIITGANSGIGLETAKELAKRGARVIMACRDLVKANTVCDPLDRPGIKRPEFCFQNRLAEVLKETTKNENILVLKLDLSSLKSVRSFADTILKTEDRLDVLINNAGVAGLKKRITEDGLESQFCTNYFGPFLLTNILIPLMERTGNARILNVSSIAHFTGTDLDLDNLNAEKKWVGAKIYPWNKLCQVLFTKELHHRLKEVNSTISVNVLHPGIVQTEIFNTSKRMTRFLITSFGWMTKTQWEGAQTSIFLAVAEEVEGLSGFYWSDCKRVEPAALTNNRGLCKNLWSVSSNHVKLQPHEYHLKPEETLEINYQNKVAQSGGKHTKIFRKMLF